MIVADIDPARATRAEAIARRDHPLLRRLWEPKSGKPVRFQPLESPARTLEIAAAQVTGLEAVEARIGEARAHVSPTWWPSREAASHRRAASTGCRAAARRSSRIHVVVGMADETHNSAFVIGPAGDVLTRYDQLAATAPLEPGTSFTSMWFRVKGVPAVVTIGRDGLWTELAELAAVAGAQVHIHLAAEPPEPSACSKSGPTSQVLRHVWTATGGQRTGESCPCGTRTTCVHHRGAASGRK